MTYSKEKTGRSRAWWLGGAVVPITAVIAFGAWSLYGSNASAARVGVVRVSGTIEADAVRIGSQRAARLARVLVAEGESVATGQVIAELEDGELRAQLEQARGNVELAEARLAELVRGAREEEVRAAAAEMSAGRAAVQGSRRALENAHLGLRRRTALQQALDTAVSGRDGAAAALAETMAGVAGAEEGLRIAQESYDANLRLRQDRDAARRQAETAEAAQSAAEARLAELRNGARSEEVRAAEAEVAQAGGAVRRARVEAKMAQADYKRARDLFADRALPARERDAAETRSEAADARRDEAEGALARAEARLALLRRGSRPEALDAAEAALRQATAAAEGSQRILATARQADELRLELRAQLETARTRRDTTQLQVARARAALDAAEATLRSARRLYADALPEKQGVDTAREALETALARGEGARARLDQLRTGATPEEIAQARAHLRTARAALALAQTQHGQSTIRAPRSGVLTERVAEPGETLNPGSIVATVTPLDEVYLTLFIPLIEMGRVRAGQEVEVTADTYPGRVYPGTITRLSDVPEFTPRSVQTPDERVRLVYQARVTVRNPRRELKPGMPADAVIHLPGSRK